MSDGPMYKAHEADKWFDRYVKTVGERDELKALSDRLAAENATLRAELAEARLACKGLGDGMDDMHAANLRAKAVFAGMEAENATLRATVARAEPAFVEAMSFRNRCTEEFVIAPLKEELRLARAVIEHKRQHANQPHRHWDHGPGCPACDAHRAYQDALEAYDAHVTRADDPEPMLGEPFLEKP